MLIVGIIMLIPVLVIALITMLVAALLIVIADERFIREIKHIINGEPSEFRDTRQRDVQ